MSDPPATTLRRIAANVAPEDEARYRDAYLRAAGDAQAAASVLNEDAEETIRALASARGWKVELVARNAEHVAAGCAVAAGQAIRMENKLRAAGDRQRELADLATARVKVVPPDEEPQKVAALVQAASTAEAKAAEADVAYVQTYGLGVPKIAPAVAVQVNVDQRDQSVRVLTVEDLRKLPDAALAALDAIEAPRDEPDAG